MEPIISPWLIYVVSLVSKISMIALIGAELLGIGVMVVGLVSLVEDHDEGKRYAKKMLWLFLACVMVLILMPDKNTVLAMLAAQYITPDNIQAVQGNIVDFVGQIAQAVKDVK